MDGIEQSETRRAGRAAVGFAVASGITAAIGFAFLLVPWPSQAVLAQTSYAACHASVKIWMGCAAGLTPLLPFALLFGGVSGVLVFVAARRR